MTFSLILQKKYGASTKHFVCENLLVEKIEFEEKVSRPPYEREFEGICKLSQIVGWAVHKLHLERSPSTSPPSDWIGVILRCWGNSSMVCQQNSDAL